MAINDHILLLMGYDLGAAYSTDDGATWTDLGTTFTDLDPYYTTRGDYGHRAACTDGNTWLVMSDSGAWTTSIDSVNWTQSVTTKPLSIGVGGVSVFAEDCIYVPARLTPTPGTRRWNRWFMCGALSTAADPVDVSEDVPALAMCALTTADTPLAGDSTWVKVAVPAGSGLDTMNMRWKSMAFDPINYRFWIIGVRYDTGNLELWYADRADLELTSGASYIILRTATATLPAELREGGLFHETVQSSASARSHQLVLNYDWRSASLRIIARTYRDRFIQTYSMPCGSAYNTGAWTATANKWIHDYTWPGLNGTAGPYDPQFYTHPGSINSEPMVGALVLSSGVPAKYIAEADAYQVQADEPVVAIQTNAGSTILALMIDDGTYRPAINRAVGGRIDVEVNWSDTGIPTTGYPTVLIQAPPAAASLATGITLTAPAMLSWHAPPPVFTGVVHADEMPTAAAEWEAPAPATFRYGWDVSDTVGAAETLEPGASTIQQLSDTLACSETVVAAATHVIREILALSSDATASASVTESIAEALLLIEGVLLQFPMELSDTVDLGETVLPVHRFVAVLADAFSLLPEITDRHKAVEALASAIVTECLTKVAPVVSVTDTVAGADSIVALHSAVATIIDGLLTVDTALLSARVVMVCADTVATGETLANTLAAMESLTDEIGLYITFRMGDEVFRGFALNTRNKAASEYTNFNFNSLAQTGGRLYLAADTGLYEHAGDDDAGTPIEAALRTGLIAIGEGRIANVVSAYIGYASDSSVVLKAIVTSPTGEKVEHWYRLAEQTSTAMREGRIKLGRGIKSAYWQFELVNVAGGTLDLHNVQLHRITLDRRI